MASPPFLPATTVPADDGIVSQFPAQERTFRDVMNSWILIDHNTSGTHAQVSLVAGTAPTVASGNTAIYRDTADSAVKAKNGTDSSVEFLLGVPPGTIVDYGGASTPTGWLLCDGTAVSRSTYARLFTAISTTWGVGDGSTTFNLPDLRGRVTAGKDSTGRLTTAGGGVDGTTLAAVGGGQNVTLLRSDLPNTTISIPVGQGSHTHAVTGGIIAGSTTGQAASGAGAGIPVSNTNIVISAATLPVMATESLNGGVTVTLPKVVQPTAIVNKIIRT